jgi:hypothetical protein
MPRFWDGQPLRESRGGGGFTAWGGRNVLELEGWRCVLDGRPDLAEVYREAKLEFLFVNTHVMELSKASGEFFTAEEADDFLHGMQLGLSLPLGRWVAPFLPAGFDEDGSLAWSNWAPFFLDSPAHESGQWWVEHRPQDMWDFLEVWMRRWMDADQRRSLSFFATSTLAAGDSAFAEQRLMTCLAAIEHLSWVSEVRSTRMTSANWRSRDAPWRIRRLVQAACIDPAISAARTPELADFARRHEGIDGPRTLTLVRDAVTHPKATEDIYQHPNLLAEASRLAGRYLDLLILHHVQYRGHARDTTQTTGWAGEADPVPWVDKT